MRVIPTCLCLGLIHSLAFGNSKNGWEQFVDENAKQIFKKILDKKTPKEQKASLKSMESLQIELTDNEKLRYLDGFESLQNLKILSLAHNRIKNVLPLTSLSNLKQLDLSDNGLSNGIAISLMNIETLEILNLSSNKLKYTFTCNFKNLKELNLSNNSIEQLQATDHANDFLNIIDISNNPTTSILTPFVLPSLKIFIANKTYLHEFSPLFACKNLEVLEVENCCNLKSIEKWFTYQGLVYTCVFPKLKRLSISQEFLNEKSKEILKSLYNGTFDHPIILNGRTIEPQHKDVLQKSVIRLNETTNEANAIH